MEQWTVTTDTRLAAALGNLGVPIRVESVMDTKDNQTRVRFFLGLINTDGDCRTKKLIRDARKGELEAREPAHPLLTGLRAIENRSLLLDCANKGRGIRLVRVRDTEIHQYVPAETGLPGVGGTVDLIKTGDIKLAAALGIVGLPVLQIDGGPGARRFLLPRYGPARHALGRVDGVQLMNDWRADMARIPWADPFAQAARCLYNRERLLDAVNRHPATLLLRKPRSVKAAYINPHATPEAFDIVHDFFNG